MTTPQHKRRAASASLNVPSRAAVFNLQAGVASKRLLPSNDARYRALIYNEDTTATNGVRISTGTPTTTVGALIPGGQSLTVHGYDAWNVIATAGTPNLSIIEESY